MKRLWVQLSLIYTTTLVGVAVILTVLISLQIASTDFADRVPEGLSAADIASLTQLNESGTLQTMFRAFFSLQIVWLFIVTIITAILVSIYANWRLTRPLTQLEEATTRAAQPSLRSYTTISGSSEIEGLASAFNTMIDELETSETRRQNLLADVSHELRTPLTVLSSNLRAMLDGVQTAEPAQIAKLYDQTRQIHHLVDDLHDLAQAEANQLPMQWETVDMRLLLTQAAELFTPLAEDQQLHLSLDLPTVAPPIRGDSARLTQVLQNLVSNALRYAHSEIALSLAVKPDCLVVSVANDGEGIAAEHLPHLFDRFYRADSSRSRETGGTGLGLAIVQSIIHAHQGTVSAQSSIPKGTVFTFTLPLIHIDQ